MGASASVQMSDCICGTEGGRSSTWTGDHVRHSLPFLLLKFLKLIETIDESAEAALAAIARKELAYLEQFGRLLLPFHCERREVYGYKDQSPSNHIKNLERYLLVASSLVVASFLVPKNPPLHHFCIRHPDLQPSNVIVSMSSDSNQLKIVGLLDWQHASILPAFLLAGIPGCLQNYGDPVSQALISPSLPANMDELDQSEQSHAMEPYHRRLVHFYYVKNTEGYNKLHHDALKAALVEATEIWGEVYGRRCAVSSRVRTRGPTQDEAKLQVADENFEECRAMVVCETETWVSNEHYEMAMALAELLKLRVLTEIPEDVRAKTEANWFLNDINEKDYM